MKRIGSIFEKIKRRPKLFFACVFFLILIIGSLLNLIIKDRADSIVLNYYFCLLFITVLFLIHYIFSGKNIALVMFLIFVPVSLFFIFIVSTSDYIIINLAAMLFTFLASLIYKIIVYLSEKHLSFRKYFLPKPLQRVSVVIPNYNYATYLKERVDSIISQTYPIHELIILDDASTDDSLSVIKEIIEDLKISRPKLKVRFIPNERNSGNVFKQWERCFIESEGDFVWIAEADDLCDKHFLSAVMRGFKDDGEVVLSYTESCTIDEGGKKQLPNLRVWVDEFKTGHWDSSYINDGKNELQYFLCSNNTIANASGVVFKKNAAPVKKYLREAQKFRLAGDWYFYAKYLLHGKIAYCSESLNFHRMHDKGVTLTTDKYQQFREIEMVQNTIQSDVKLTKLGKKKVSDYKQIALSSFGLSEEELKYMKIPFSRILKKSGVVDDVLLSVIVSAYNAEEYIDKCLSSVEKSLPEKSEIIVVDDGSTDNTARIVKEYKKSPYGELRYYYKKNGGLSSAKNFGLSKARGRYIIFMDADDEIKPNGYEVMLKMALDNNADVVVCDMALIYDDGTVINCPVYHKKPGGLKGFLVDGLMASSNNKMVKKELFDKVGKYPEGLNNEDVAITPVLMALSKNTQYVPSSFYKYYQRKGSIQNSEFSEKRLAIFETVKMAISSIQKIIPDEIRDISGIIISNQLIALLVHVMCNIEEPEKRNLFIAEFCRKYRELEIKNNKYINKYCRDLKLDDLPEYLIKANPGQIYAYIKKDNKKFDFVDYIGRAFGIKKFIKNEIRVFIFCFAVDICVNTLSII